MGDGRFCRGAVLCCGALRGVGGIGDVPGEAVDLDGFFAASVLGEQVEIGISGGVDGSVGNKQQQPQQGHKQGGEAQTERSSANGGAGVDGIGVHGVLSSGSCVNVMVLL